MFFLDDIMWTDLGAIGMSVLQWVGLDSASDNGRTVFSEVMICVKTKLVIVATIYPHCFFTHFLLKKILLSGVTRSVRVGGLTQISII